MSPPGRGARDLLERFTALGRLGVGRATARLRALPDFLVIGAQRGGTTSFYDALVGHPRIRAAAVKEVHYFDLNLARGPGWYRAHFPVGGAPAERGGAWLTGEATPYYLFHPDAPERVRALVPQVRLIALLRDPVARAWSHYRREVRLGREPLGFAEAVAAEPARLAEEARALPDTGRRFAAPHHRHHSYLARGRYAEQLERWLAAFPRERLLVLASEAVHADPGKALDEAAGFLGLPGHAWQPRRLQGGGDAPLDAALEARLRAGFAEANQRLYALLGRDLGWPG